MWKFREEFNAIWIICPCSYFNVFLIWIWVWKSIPYSNRNSSRIFNLSLKRARLESSVWINEVKELKAYEYEQTPIHIPIMQIILKQLLLTIYLSVELVTFIPLSPIVVIIVNEKWKLVHINLLWFNLFKEIHHTSKLLLSWKLWIKTQVLGLKLSNLELKYQIQAITWHKINKMLIKQNNLSIPFEISEDSFLFFTFITNII